MSTSTATADPVRKHRREVWLKIYAPVLLFVIGLVVVCAALVVGVATGTLVHTQVTAVMGVLFTVFVAFPLALVCLVPYFLIALGAYGSGRLYAQARRPLRVVRRLTARTAAQTDRLAPHIARPFVGLNTRLTRWEHTLRGWLRQPEPGSGPEHTQAEKEIRHE